MQRESGARLGSGMDLQVTTVQQISAPRPILKFVRPWTNSCPLPILVKVNMRKMRGKKVHGEPGTAPSPEQPTVEMGL